LCLTFISISAILPGMKKINNKIINHGLKVLTILAFVLVFVPFNKASAAYGTNIIYQTGDNSYSGYNNNLYYNNNQNTYQLPTYQPPIYTPPPATTPTPIVYSNSVNPNATSATTTPKTVAKAKTTNTSNTIATTKSNGTSGLAASVIYGANSFLPSGLIQWILFGIFILLLIILGRRTLGAREKYLAIPMKYK